MRAGAVSCSNEVSFRFASVEDGAALARLNRQLIEDEGHRNPMNEPELQQRMRRWLEGEYKAVVFELNGSIAGYALLKYEEAYVYLRQFFVRREFRRRKIGSEALRWMRDNALNGHTRMRLDVLAGNEGGIHFWRATGFSDYCITMELESAPGDDRRERNRGE